MVNGKFESLRRCGLMVDNDNYSFLRGHVFNTHHHHLCFYGIAVLQQYDVVVLYDRRVNLIGYDFNILMVPCCGKAS